MHAVSNPNGVESQKHGPTPLGLPSLNFSSQGSRETRQPWAVFRNRFAVKAKTMKTISGRTHANSGTTR
jgi:hypothetical protein